MNYHNITSPDMLNGSGLRTVLWVSGCTHNCPGCHNPQTHPFSSGIEFDELAMDELLQKSAPDYIEGLTFSGGDPFMPMNALQCADIASEFKKRYPSKNIWAYTGYTFERLLEMEIPRKLLNLVDVLVDGRFILEKKDPLLHFRGSSNQRIIDVKKSTKDKIVLVDV